MGSGISWTANRTGLHLTNRLEHLAFARTRSTKTPHHGAHLLAVKLFGERRPRRDLEEGEEPVELPRGRWEELAVPAQHFASALERPQRRPRHNVAHRMERNSNSVTTPKFPPPPRNAQKRSVCSLSLARTMDPFSKDHLR